MRSWLGAVVLLGVLIALATPLFLWLATVHRASPTATVVTPPAPVPPTGLIVPPPRHAAPAKLPEPPALAPLPPLPPWKRHLPLDLPPEPTDERGRERDFRGQILTAGSFSDHALGGAVFAGADLLQARFIQSDLTNADFRGADVSQATFEGADLEGARFDGAMLLQTTLVGSDTGAVAGKTRVRDGVIEPVPAPPLPARHAGHASFRGARFAQVRLDGMDLAGADLRGAEFLTVWMRNADLRGADLRDSRHEGTDFEGARLDRADLRGADLTHAENLTLSQLARARTDGATRLPRF